MNARWMSAAAAVTLLAGCPDPDPEPAQSVIPGLTNPAAIALTPVAQDTDPIARAATCLDVMADPLARPARGDACALEPTQPVLAAHPDVGATLMLDVGRGVPRCGPVDAGPVAGLRVRYTGADGRVTGEVLAVDWACAEQEMGEDPGPCVARFLEEAWQMIADAGEEGFVSARDARAAFGRSQTADHTPVAILGGGLDGWMVYVRDTAAGPLELVLVNPANTEALPLAVVPDSAQPDALGSVHHVIEVEAGRLRVTVGVHTPGECDPETIQVIDVQIPAAAR